MSTIAPQSIDVTQDFQTREEVLALHGLNSQGIPTERSLQAASPPSQFLQDINTTYEQLGGQTFLREWAEDNRSTFVSMLMQLNAPLRQSPSVSVTDNRSVTILHGVPASPLDSA